MSKYSKQGALDAHSVRFMARPPSDTPLVSNASSPKESYPYVTGASDDSGETSSTTSPSSAPAVKSKIPPLSLPTRRATTLDVPGLTRSKVSPDGKIAARDIEAKLVIVMVGLPARGKSYVTKKLARYLNWQQHDCKIFNVGNTRRKSNTKVGPAQRPLPDGSNNPESIADAFPDSQDEQENEHDHEADSTLGPEEHPETSHAADFFSPDNTNTFKLREQWAMDTLDQLLDFVLDKDGSVGILDATNTTRARRKKVIDRINERTGGRLKVLFLESICNNQEIIESNIRLKLSGPDYKSMDQEVALNDFRGRLHNYEKAYETLGGEEEEYQYIKMIDVGRKVVCANIKGFLAGQAVFFLLNFNLSPRQIWITRHGESVDNAMGRIGGDADLTPRGQKFARALARFMDYQKSEFRKRQIEEAEAIKHEVPEEPHFCVWTSMLRRSIETAAPFNEDMFDIKEMRMLNELGAGICDGFTYSEIKEKYPQEYEARISDKIRYRYPGIGGESYLDVINRLRQVIVEMERMEDNVLVVCHRVVARVLLAYFMNLGREAIGDLDIPLHTLYMMEPKPYGVDWAVFEYHEDTDWFYRIPKETLQKRNAAGQQRAKSASQTAPRSSPASNQYIQTKDRTFSVVPTATSRDHEQFRSQYLSNLRGNGQGRSSHVIAASPALSSSSESATTPDVGKLSIE